MRFKAEIDYGNVYLYLKVHKNTELSIVCTTSEVEYVEVGSFYSSAQDDTNKFIYFNVDGEFYSLYEILCEASLQLPDIVSETSKEERDERQMERELSSPYLTGRI